MDQTVHNFIKSFHQFIDHYILASITFCFLAGMSFSYGRIVPTQYFYIATLLIILFLFVYHKNHLLLRYLLCLLFAICGLLHQSQSNHLPAQPNHIFHHINSAEEVVIVGTITEMTTYNGKTSRLFLKSEFIRNQHSQQLESVTGLVQLSYGEKLSDIYTPGTKVAVRTKLKVPAGYIGSGVFYYPKFLAQKKNIWVKGFIRSPLFIYPVNHQPSFIEVLTYFPEKVRNKIGSELDKLVPKTAGLYRAILIGDKSQIDNVTLESFKACGIMHILAISGLHIAVITGLTYTIFLLSLRQSTYLLLAYDIRKIAAILTIPFLIFYSLLTGCNAPVIRSLFMSILVLSALCINRRKSPLTLLCFAALTIVIFSPHQLFMASFQLSFAAISGILFIFPTIQRLFPEKKTAHDNLYGKLKAILISSLLISTVACISTLPLLLFYFNRFSVISPITNLLIEPIICLWSLPLGIIATTFLNIAPPIAELLLFLGSLGLLITEELCLQLTKLPFIQFWFPTPPLYLIALYYISLLLFMKSRNHTFKKIVGIFFIIILLAFISPIQRPLPHDQTPKITIVDVGQGSSTLIEFSHNQNVLVDCGNITFSDRSIGEQVVAPLLWKKGIRKIDTIFITHGDADHYNGIPFIVEQFGVSNIVVADTEKYGEEFSSMLMACKLLGVNITTARKGDLFSFDKGAVHCIHNFAENRKLFSRNEKNRGLVLKVKINETSILLPGDIDKEAENQLLDLSIDTDLLLAAHHGSKTSSSRPFLKKVSPHYLLVSSSVSRRQYFPHSEVISRAKNHNIPILSTPDYGSLEIIINKQGYRITGNRNRYLNPLLKAKKTCLSCSHN